MAALWALYLGCQLSIFASTGMAGASHCVPWFISFLRLGSLETDGESGQKLQWGRLSGNTAKGGEQGGSGQDLTY